MARDLTGQRDWEAPRVPATVRQRYVSTILEIGREVRRTRELHGAGFVIGVSADAAALHRTWARKWERSLGASGERHGIKGWGSKAYGLVWRLSGLLHLVRHGAHGSVDVATLDAAITLVSHFAEHQLAAVDELGLEPRMRAARELAAWIVDRGALEMTAREAKRALSVPSKGHVNAAIKLLMENGYVNESPAKEGPGRKSERYFVNPAALHSGSFGRRSRGVSGEVGREVPPKTALEDVSKSPKPPPDWTGTEAAEVAL